MLHIAREMALGKDRTNACIGAHRKINTSVFSFHSLRSTYTSMLAAKNVSAQDAMKMPGRTTQEMVKSYEREL